MNALKISSILLIVIFFAACGGETNEQENNGTTEEPQSMVKTAEEYDPKRGEGKFSDVPLGETLDKTLAEAGASVSGVKCASCHKYTDERLVGPGWKGVTERRTPAWIMNFITNPDPMIDKDPELQAQLELCLVRMPNQSLTDDEARGILEFMRQNDGVQ